MKNLKEVYENNYISNETFEAEDNKGEFKFQLGVDITDLERATSEGKGYLICINAAKLPKFLPKKQLKQVAESCGIKTKEVTVTDIISYGISVPMENFTVKDKYELKQKLNEIDEKIWVYGRMCGFYFDNNFI